MVKQDGEASGVWRMTYDRGGDCGKTVDLRMHHTSVI
jgi:hypothetical protein